MRFTVLTTCPPYGSKNVGDKLIEQRTKELLRHIKGEVEFLTIFREEALDDRLDEINQSEAVLMPACPVRDTPMYPRAYRLTKDLDMITAPLVPVGANWNVYPGDGVSRRDIQYSGETARFLKHLSKQNKHFSCREYYTVEVLKKHGIDNAYFTGDPAWYHVPSFGKSMHRPEKVRKLVFSPPLSAFYLSQAKRIMSMLRETFSTAEIICAMHLADSGGGAGAAGESKVKSENSAAMSADVAVKNNEVRRFAAELGLRVEEMAGDLDKLELYDECDLHVGYECHAHLYFFSHRIPSVLIAEDARGFGFNYTLGHGAFTGFRRVQGIGGVAKKSHTSGYCTSLEELELAVPRNDIAEEIKFFVQREEDSAFRRYLGLPEFLDETFKKNMKPFIASL